jgi:ribosome-binding protein aMBF1 (putative translation factor)
MKTSKNKTTTLEQLTTSYFGDVGSPSRDSFNQEYEAFKLGYLIKKARKKKGMTQQALAQKIGSTKSYISLLENDVKEVRLSTLKKLISEGLGGTVQIKVQVGDEVICL